ncbi:AAA family ATPase [Mycolicibacterium mucogenicum]|uniref:AAA family ATPase n=1 Tax=Mycolicibacterium mucogenicum TaxID=56689 RepID=UPI00226A47EE|nr:AAA family ATPase [Mycolicibacterium mucogenicum]MCX8564017.1 AAA family ATPase [Mycolicibacterium mucogenicum]
MEQESQDDPAGSEESVQDVIVRLLDEDKKLDEAAKDVVLSALAEVGDGSRESADTDWSPTFLTSIKVSGFRGIGSTAKLDLHPAPGLTVVSGRNGSGKSSFAEALELALTGTSYRWKEKQALWAESWRNLHRPRPTTVRVGFTREGSGPIDVGVDWTDEAVLADCEIWTQVPSQERVPGIDSLGWAYPLELCRPVLSYEELGQLFDGGPSKLYDALAKLLGLEVLAEVEKKLAADLKNTKSARDTADAARRQAVVPLADCDDERAPGLVTLLNKRVRPVDEILAIVTGSGTSEQSVINALRALTQLEAVSVEDISTCATRLRTASAAVETASEGVIAAADKRVSVLKAALDFHDEVGDGDCPVCGVGQLDATWAQTARSAIVDDEAALAEYRSATTELKAATTAAAELISRFRPAQAVPGVDLSAMEAFNTAVAAAGQMPVGGAALADHLESKLVDVVGAAELLRAQAQQQLAEREGAWAPLAAQVAAWIPLEQRACELDGLLKATTAAKKWVTDNGTAFRNLRLKPIAEQARHIWSLLRQESNVELGDITLAGTATKRRVMLGGSVDGKPTQALSVMSQGEQNAIALALFLPRATSTKSPFRFVVLDDPIQAMDPAKIDGFVRVMVEIARTHQVVVFSHDDRLASVIRETGVDARLVEVVRSTESQVKTRTNMNPAKRLVNDALAVVRDKDVPDDVQRRVAPSLFRMALEEAAKQAYFARQSRAGRSRVEAEDNWQSAKKTRNRLALAVLGDSSADLTDWSKAKPWRKRAIDIGNAGMHGAGHVISKEDASDLDRAVSDLLALQ